MKPQIQWQSFLVMLAILLAGCGSPAQPQPTMTATPSITPTFVPTQTPTPSPSATVTSVPSPTSQTGCIDSALYIQDVTIPDNTRVKAGETFTKTWRLRNTGKCIWNLRYALAFVGGEQMNAAPSTPLSETPPGNTLDISVNLTAPRSDGIYTGLYELRDPTGKKMPIGLLTSMWVKIAVGNVSLTPAATPASPQPGITPAPGATTAPSVCNPQQNGGYTAQVLALINGARADAKLNPLNLNAQLAAAAQGHSDDMACNNFLAHTGSNGSSIHQRVVAAGYNPTYSEEIIFASGTPQDAFRWWMNDPVHRDAILNPKVVDMGAGYTYSASSAYGGYYTVDFGAP